MRTASAHIVSPAVSLPVQGAQVVDLARMVEVMLYHRGDNPPGLFLLTPVRHPRAWQIGIIKTGDAVPEAFLALTQPGNRCRWGVKHVLTIDERMVPCEEPSAEGVVVVHELAAADVLDHIVDGTVPSRRHPGPILRRDGLEVVQQGMPRSLERRIQQV